LGQTRRAEAKIQETVFDSGITEVRQKLFSDDTPIKKYQPLRCAQQADIGILEAMLCDVAQPLNGWGSTLRLVAGRHH
jgi:hypothetical protein